MKVLFGTNILNAAGRKREEARGALERGATQKRGETVGSRESESLAGERETSGSQRTRKRDANASATRRVRVLIEGTLTRQRECRPDTSIERPPEGSRERESEWPTLWVMAVSGTNHRHHSEWIMSNRSQNSTRKQHRELLDLFGKRSINLTSIIQMHIYDQNATSCTSLQTSILSQCLRSLTDTDAGVFVSDTHHSHCLD